MVIEQLQNLNGLLTRKEEPPALAQVGLSELIAGKITLTPTTPLVSSESGPPKSQAQFVLP